MVNVTNGADVAVRFVADEFCLTHGREPLSRKLSFRIALAGVRLTSASRERR
jgi:hypothetical protein